MKTISKKNEFLVLTITSKSMSWNQLHSLHSCHLGVRRKKISWIIHNYPLVSPHTNISPASPARIFFLDIKDISVGYFRISYCLIHIYPYISSHLCIEISFSLFIFIQIYPDSHAFIFYCISINILVFILYYPLLSSYLSFHILSCIFFYPFMSSSFI